MYFLFYLMAVADKLHDLFGIGLFIAGIALVVFTIWLLNFDDSDMYEDYRKDPKVFTVQYLNVRKIQRFLMYCVPVVALMFVGTPTKKEAVLIVAGGYIGSFIQSDSNARALPADITRFLRAEINQAAREADLGSILEPAEVKQKRDSLSNLTKEQLVEGVLKKE